jgi:hypothetical protein
MDLSDHEMEDPSADNLSEGSSVGELVECVHQALEKFINSSKTTKNGSFIVKKEVFADVLHSFANLEEVIDNLPGDKSPPPSTPPTDNNKKILERLDAIEKQIQRIQYARQPHSPRQPTWADIAACPLPPTAAVPRGRAITLRPTDDNTFKGKETQEILKEIRTDLPGAVGVRPLRSGDVRVVLKDSKDKEYAVMKGRVGSARILRQDFPVEVSGVPLQIKVHHGKEAEARNHTLIQEITKDNRYLTTGAISRIGWLHGERTEKSGKARSSLVVYLSAESLRDKALQEGITIKGVWYNTKLWSHALQTPRCFRCNQWCHTQSTCAAQPVCGHCAGNHDTRNCHQTTKTRCSNCGKAHKAWDRGVCAVYKVAKESAARLRHALLMETARIQMEKNKQTGPQPAGKSTPVAPLPARRGKGRPSDLERAGTATGQQSLGWLSQPAAASTDMMEE